ncbi:hypothetical protein C8J56DRAFT_408079 [Mycena floridula]|nr:hypothetical protein C8J56DRAFT_408079 [Mycena floridula]
MTRRIAPGGLRGGMVVVSAQAFSQAVRKYVVKIIKLSLWNSDLLLGHYLLFMVSPPLLIPGFDRLHAVMLFWLHPSKQIRTTLYLMKQSSQRQAIIIKYGSYTSR